MCLRRVIPDSPRNILETRKSSGQGDDPYTMKRSLQVFTLFLTGFFAIATTFANDLPPRKLETYPSREPATVRPRLPWLRSKVPNPTPGGRKRIVKKKSAPQKKPVARRKLPPKRPVAKKMAPRQLPSPARLVAPRPAPPVAMVRPAPTSTPAYASSPKSRAPAPVPIPIPIRNASQKEADRTIRLDMTRPYVR